MGSDVNTLKIRHSNPSISDEHAISSIVSTNLGAWVKHSVRNFNISIISLKLDKTKGKEI